jgi:ParB family chromosome partitioning protein
MSSVISLSKIVIESNIRSVAGIADLAKVTFDDLPPDEQGTIKELAASIDREGLINPLTVKDLGGGSKFRLIAGWRRYMALKYLGKTKADVKSIKGTRDSEVLIQLVENIHREDLNPYSVAKGLEDIKRIKNISKQAELAKFVHKSEAWISQHLSLLTSAPAVQKAVKNGEMGVGAARAINKLPKHEQDGAVKEAKADAKKTGKSKVTVKGARRQARKRQSAEKGKQQPLKPIAEREQEEKTAVIADFFVEQYGDYQPSIEVRDAVKSFWDYLFAKHRLSFK